ncbi:MAG: hypothetical protein ABIK79_11635 [Chloroflexota bacterium]
MLKNEVVITSSEVVAQNGVVAAGGGDPDTAKLRSCSGSID